MSKYSLIATLFVLSMITYIDRVCISSAKEPIARELSLSDQGMGLVFGAFALGYALAQIPAGRFADRRGPRLALTAMVGAWSVLTALTGAAWSLGSLAVVRFVFGVTEAGAFPATARAFSTWLEAGERGRANGIVFSGSRIGAALSFPLLAWMLGVWRWRITFVLLGAMGVAWAIAWYARFRDYPPGKAAERVPDSSLESAIPWWSWTFDRRFWPALAQYFAGNFTFFVCLSWMLPYMKKEFRLGDTEAAGYTMVPLLFGATSQWITGFLVDRIFHSRWRPWSRRAPAIVGFALSAAGLCVVSGAATPVQAVVFFTLATFGAEMTISPSWTYCTDVAGANAGSVSGTMNMFGNLGSFVSANAFPYLYALTGSASAYFLTAAALNTIGAACWARMRSLD